MNKFKVNDNVLIINGRDKGKDSVITRFSKCKQFVFLDNLNVYKKHLKKSENNNGGIVDIPVKVHVSNIVYLNSSKKPCKIKYSIEKNIKNRNFIEKR